MLRVASLVLKELAHRRWNALLSIIALAAAVALCVALAMMHEASLRETRRVTRDIGFNLRIIPRDTDMDAFWLSGVSDRTMPEDAVSRLAAVSDVSYNHLVATLQRRIPVEGRDVLLTGLAPEVLPPGEKKSPMSPTIKPGTAHVGARVAERLHLKAKGTLTVGDRTFVVERTMPETGTVDDVRVIVDLADAQAVLGLPGQINEIKAIDCLCLTPDKNPLGILRTEIAEIVPEAQVLLMSDMAEARARQRRTGESYVAFVTPVLLTVCAVWVGALAILNVKQRATELGLLRGLGFGTPTIAGLIVGRAVVLGLLGAVPGYALGTWLGLTYGPQIFQLTAGAIAPQPALLSWALALTPLFAAAVSLVPAAVAIVQDPAVTLSSE